MELKNNKNKMKRESKIIDKDLVKSNIQVFKENNVYYFESNNEKLSNFITNDYMEAVAAFMKLKDTFDLNYLWDIKVTDEMRENLSVNKTLYWITGGDREWVENKTYKKTWIEYSNIFVKKYQKRIETIKECKTLGEVRDEFLKHMNLPMIYEFALTKNMI
jgi:hypothetical protein